MKKKELLEIIKLKMDTVADLMICCDSLKERDSIVKQYSKELVENIIALINKPLRY